MRQTLILITLISILISCEKKENDILPNVDSYPMTVGTEWSYDRQVIIKKYESETSNNIVGVDTVNFTVKVWIEKDTILNDTMNVKIFKSQENDNNWTSNQFKYLDNEGLRNYAYSNSGGANVFAKKSSSIKYGLHTDFYKTGVNEILTSDDIIFEDKPTLDIKLPLGDNSSWTYRKPSETRKLQIDKSVVGNETLILNGKSYACYKVTWTYLNDPVFDGIEITDWISDKGLIKRETIHDRVTLTTQDGEPIGGNVQTREILTLKALTIK
jgi:hypothetical protein